MFPFLPPAPDARASSPHSQSDQPSRPQAPSQPEPAQLNCRFHLLAVLRVAMQTR